MTRIKVKTTTKKIVEHQLVIYGFIADEYKPKNITRKSKDSFVYEYVEGNICGNIALIWYTAQIALWKNGPPRPISLTARLNYYKYVCDLWDEPSETIRKTLVPIITDPLTPISYAHGDMTCCNAILSTDDRIVFIDPADSHGLECREIDEAKLLQSRQGWEKIKYNKTLTYDDVPFEIRGVHRALLLSHYVRMLRYQSALYEYVLEKIKDLCERRPIL